MTWYTIIPYGMELSCSTGPAAEKLLSNRFGQSFFYLSSVFVCACVCVSVFMYVCVCEAFNAHAHDCPKRLDNNFSTAGPVEQIPYGIMVYHVIY